MIEKIKKKLEELLKQGASNIKGNIQMLSDPQTRGVWLRGLFSPIEVPIRQAGENIRTSSFFLTDPRVSRQTRETFAIGLQQKDVGQPQILQIPRQFIANVTIPTTGGIRDIREGVEKIKTEDLPTKLSGAAQIGRGVSKIIAPATPIGLTSNIASTILPDDSLLSRLSAGIYSGLTGEQKVAQNVKEKKTKLPVLGEVDIVKGVGSLIGFTQSPHYRLIFNVTNKILPTASLPFKKWLAVAAARGGLEQAIISIPDMPKDLTPEQKAKFITENTLFGAMAGVVGEGVLRYGGRMLKKEEAVKLYDDISSFKEKANRLVIDKKTGKVMPLWKKIISSEAPFGFRIEEVKEGSLLSDVSRAVKGGKITMEEGEAILGRLKEAPPPPPKISVGESRGEVKMGLSQATDTTSDKIVNNIKNKIDNLYTQIIDRFNPLIKIAEKAGEERAMRHALTGHYGAGSTANYHIDFELKPILREQNINNLKKVAIALRDAELAQRGIQGSNTGLTVEGLKKELGEKQFNDILYTLSKLYKYQDDIVKEYLVKTGIISEKSYQAMRAKNQFYIPFKRVMDVVDENLGFVPQTKGAGSVASQDVVYKIKGSERELIDPIESIIEATYKIVGLGKRQKVAKTIVSLKDKLPQGMIEKIEGKVGDTPHISLFENGKVVHYKAPLEVIDAAKGLSEDAMSNIVKILSYPTQFFRATATGINPEFMAPNILRDLQSSFVNIGLNPLGWVKGLAHMIKKDEIYQEFLKSGGRSTTRIAIDRPMLQKKAAEITGTATSRGIEMLKPSNILKTLQMLGEYSETPTRVAVFEQEFLKGLSKGLSKEQAAIEAAYWAQEATVNFARRGAATKTVNALYAFLNARTQGVDRLIRSFKKDPVGVGFRLGLITQIPALVLYSWNRMFDSYYDKRVVSDSDKENNFIIMLSDTPIPALKGAQFIKIPKGDVGRLANPLEQFLAFADNKGGDVKKAIAQVLKGFSPISNIGDIFPTFFKPLVEVFTNKSFFADQPIVPEHKINYPEKYQYSEYTAPLYRMIGEKLNLPPAKIQAIVEGYGTGIAKIGELMTRPFIPSEYKTGISQTAQINRTPIVRRFLGGEKRTIEEQMRSNEKRKKAIELDINQIKAGIKKGDIPPEEGIKQIEKLKEKQKKIDKDYPVGIVEESQDIDLIKLKFQYSPDKITFIGDTVLYKDKENKVKEVDLSPVPKPRLTENDVYNKKIISSYNSKITKQQNAIIDLVELGYISEEEAIELIQQLENVKIKGGEGRVRKASGKRVAIRRVGVSAPRIRVRQPARITIPFYRPIGKRIRIISRPSKMSDIEYYLSQMRKIA